MTLAELTLEERNLRIQQLRIAWNIDLASSQRSSESHELKIAPSFRTPDDEVKAEALLRRRQLETPIGIKKSSSLKRAFTNRKKGWQPIELLDALDVHVCDGGSPGVAEVLLGRLAQLGASINEQPTERRSSFIGRRRSEGFGYAERTRVVENAVKSRNVDMLRALLPYADSVALDSAIVTATLLCEEPMVEILISKGADPFRDLEGQSAFLELCDMGGQENLVRLLVSGAKGSHCLAIGMVKAVKSGCFVTVLQISQSMADCDYNCAEALRIAIENGRKDIALAIVTAKKPPQPAGLEAALDTLFEQSQVHPHEKLDMTELLLCAGARGDAASRALLHAASSQFVEMVRLLIRYGASVQYLDGAVIKEVVTKGHDNLLKTLLSSGLPLSPQLASDCVKLIPPHINPDCRYSLLTMLLRNGASGECLDEALVQAVLSGNDTIIDLLVKPEFPNKGSTTCPSGRQEVLNSHAIASVDYKNGEAIKAALAAGDISVISTLLSVGPSPETLAHTFTHTHRLPREARQEVVHCFIEAGVPANVIKNEFRREIEQHSGHRDDDIVAILLNYMSKEDFDITSAITAAIARQDRSLLATVVQHATNLEAAESIPKAMSITDEGMRREIITLLLVAGADAEKARIVAAVMTVLKSEPVDVKLLRLLLTRGHADMNELGGSPLLCALAHPDPLIFPLVLKNTTLAPATILAAISKLLSQPDSKEKISNLTALLRLSVPKADLGDLLADEVHSFIQTPKADRNIRAIQAMVQAGADVNGPEGLALARAVSATHMPLTEMLLAENPTPETMAYAFRQAINLLDPIDRLKFAERLLKSSILPTEVDQALIYSIKKYPEDLDLLGLLMEKADMSSGEALNLAISHRKLDIVKLLLGNKHSDVVLIEAFKLSLACTEKEDRQRLTETFLNADIPKQIVRDSLSTAAGQGDLELVNTLVTYGGKVHDIDRQSMIQAVRSESPEMLKMLLGEENGAISPETLNAAFHTATQISDLEKRSLVFEILLLQGGIENDLASAELLFAVEGGVAGVKLLTVLLSCGADPNFRNAEAICVAAQNECFEGLQLLLARENPNTQQIKPTSISLAIALKASWKLQRDKRLKVAEWLFDAGLELCVEIHIALQKTLVLKAGEELDVEMMKLLLSKRASPTYDGCKSLIRAACIPSPSILGLLLEHSDISDKEASAAFTVSFPPDAASRWLSEDGYQCAKLLIEKGASGDGLSIAFVVVLEARNSSNSSLVDKFADFLIDNGADINYSHSRALRMAVSRGNIQWVQKLLDGQPSSSSLSAALGHVFDGNLDENEATLILHMILSYNYEGVTIDTGVPLQGDQIPVLARALLQFPRSTKMMTILLEAGYYYDPMLACFVGSQDKMSEREQEQVTLLVWAIIQPEKRISSAVIETLIKAGAAVNFQTPRMQMTPLMLAIREKRPDVVKALVLNGADVDLVDAYDTSALLMAASLRDSLATDVMSTLLLVGPAKNDGSLHSAARQLNLATVELLLKHHHDADFPSLAHDGRSALAELCLHACDEGSPPLTNARQLEMRKTMEILIKHGSDLEVKSLNESSGANAGSGKTLYHLAMESASPWLTLQALLKAGLWKLVNEPFTHFVINNMTYSLTMYVRHVRPWDEFSDSLLTLLRNNRTVDVFYANEGPQPDNVIGLPNELVIEERDRIARQKQESLMREKHLQHINYQRELAAIDSQLWKDKAAMEDVHRTKVHRDEIAASRERRMTEVEHFQAMLDAKTAAQRSERAHLTALDRASALRLAREIEADETRHRKLLDFESHLATERAANQRAVSQIELERQQHIARYEREASERDLTRIQAHKQLIQDQSALAMQLGNTRSMAQIPARKAVGYVTDIQ
ncbi:hypothetical protein Cpir12675_001135 [Ceratocystis pirilliformis]|uniref:Uncharacterized protein n=1 Tax=Ceratocystis pirilliformis TaxID=259994 RepID=A0ABR3ZIP6_9PEZI